MKSYPTYTGQGFLSFLGLFYAFGPGINIYIHRIWQYQELFVYYK